MPIYVTLMLLSLVTTRVYTPLVCCGGCLQGRCFVLEVSLAVSPHGKLCLIYISTEILRRYVIDSTFSIGSSLRFSGTNLLYYIIIFYYIILYQFIIIFCIIAIVKINSEPSHLSKVSAFFSVNAMLLFSYLHFVFLFRLRRKNSKLQLQRLRPKRKIKPIVQIGATHRTRFHQQNLENGGHLDQPTKKYVLISNINDFFLIVFKIPNDLGPCTVTWERLHL